MNKLVAKILVVLKSFLEYEHKNGADCIIAELFLQLAKETLLTAKNKDEEVELDKIIKELEQLHNVCFLQKQLNEEDDDSSEYGV